jgi:LysM domain
MSGSVVNVEKNLRTCFWLLMLLLGLANPAYSCDLFHCVGQAVGDGISAAGKAGGDVVKGVGHATGQVVSGGGQVLGGVIGTVSPNAGNAVKDGARRLGNNIEQGAGAVGDGAAHVVHEAGNQVAENPVGVLIAILYPPAAPFVLGAPTIGQAIACSISEHLKAKESCDVVGTLASLSRAPVATLGEVDIDVAPLTTLFKCLGIEGWLDTGCEAVGSGRPVREAQLSNDGFWTIDVALDNFQIQGKPGDHGRYIRLEVRPNRPAHSITDHHLFTHDDHICFGGPVLIDKGKWLEVHPIADFGNCPESPVAANEGGNLSREHGWPLPGTNRSPGNPTDSPQEHQGANAPTNTHVVKKGECLSTIAQEYYGKQTWPRVYRANRKHIKDPDLIYPGQVLVVPPT